jgi:nucleotide-binding universal stress UspA family protein
MSIRKILVPTDFSETSEAAARYALELAATMGASVTLLHAYALDVYPVGADGAVYIPSPETVAETMRAAGRELDRFRTRLPQGIPIDARTMEGRAAEAIVSTARDHGFDLVVMGTHGRTGLRHLLIGSVAEHVVRTSAVPVLTVRPPTAAQVAASPPAG